MATCRLLLQYVRCACVRVCTCLSVWKFRNYSSISVCPSWWYNNKTDLLSRRLADSFDGLGPRTETSRVLDDGWLARSVHRSVNDAEAFRSVQSDCGLVLCHVVRTLRPSNLIRRGVHCGLCDSLNLCYPDCVAIIWKSRDSVSDGARGQANGSLSLSPIRLLNSIPAFSPRSMPSAKLRVTARWTFHQLDFSVRQWNPDARRVRPKRAYISVAAWRRVRSAGRAAGGGHPRKVVTATAHCRRRDKAELLATTANQKMQSRRGCCCCCCCCCYAGGNGCVWSPVGGRCVRNGASFIVVGGLCDVIRAY